MEPGAPATRSKGVDHSFACEEDTLFPAITLSTWGLFPAALCLLALAACGGDDEVDGTTTATPTGQATATQTPAAGACGANLEIDLPEGLTWADILPPTIPAPDGWEVAPDPNIPYLEVRANGEAVGYVELLTFPLPEGFRPEEGIAAVEAWAEELYAGVEADREASYGEGYSFERHDIAPVSAGDVCLARYGFSVMDAAGTEVERFIAYATFDSDTLVLITATHDPGLAGELSFIDVESLIEYEPSFGRLIPQLQLSGAVR